MSSNIKHTQLTRVGYTYQDYICVKLLIDWFHDPEKYQWVSIEGADTEQDELNTIDDVIALDKDGKYSLLQVKFTIDSNRDDLKLDFDWLLKKKGSGTSLIQKWQRDVKTYGEKNRLAIAALRTNRKPDEELGKCLQDKKINIDLIPRERLEEVIAQVGSYDSAKNFFAEFIFDHSQPEIEDLYEQLFNKIVPNHASPEGWYRFLEAVQRWATHKNEPSPNGQITLSHLYELFDSGIGRSLSQFFEVPEGYEPPTGQFHAEMLQRANAIGGWVVSGLPGMGKSTYLSFLTTQLVNQQKPVIRHHYSLSTQSIVDRTTYPNVARSLQHQLQINYPELFAGHELDADKLDNWLTLASEHAKSLGNNLVVIIDGLDHISREHKEITQLEHLVNRLLPFKDRVCLIFGTQPVSDAHLPARLSAEIPKKDRWLNLPAMDLYSIKCWVESLSSGNKIALTIHGENESEALVEVSEALLKVSGGYPLHIFYSLQNLSLLGKSINKYEIEKLPTCPDGDIYIYYGTLWSSLSETARVVLLLIACVDFPWPDKNSIGSCFGNSLEFMEAFSKVQHLIEKRRSGVFPFHSSILVFLRERQDFKDTSRALLIKVRDWLEADAPLYWRWGWRWIIEAHLGNSDSLINGITREWLIGSICSGYPPLHIEHIISMAERIALERGVFAELVRLRLLKIRLINGPEFQIQEYSQFMRCALSWSDERYGLLWGADNLRMLDEKELPVIGVLFRGIDGTVSEDCFKEIMRRIEFYAKIDSGSSGEKVTPLIDAAIDVLCDTDSPSIDKIMHFMSRVISKRPYFIKLFDRLIEAGNAHVILDIPPSSLPEEVTELFWHYFILACGILKVSIVDRPERTCIESSALGRIALTLNDQTAYSDQLKLPALDWESDSVAVDVLCETFFVFFARQLQKPCEVVCPSEIRINSAQSFIRKSVEILEYAAFHIASCLNSGLQAEAFELHEVVFQSRLPRVRGHDYHLTGAEFSFEQALARISVLLHVVLGSSRIKPITVPSMEALSNNPWWYAQGWLKNAATIIPTMVSNEFADRLIESRIEELKLERSDTSTLANESLDVARLALALGRKEVGRKCLALAAQHTLGYGWRKDTTFSELFDAIQYCSDYGVGNIPDWLRRVAPFVNDVFEFSEREIRHIPGWYLKLLAKHVPERLVDEFDYHLKSQNWRILPEILENFVEQCDLSYQADHALLRCLSSHGCISALKERAGTDVRFLALLEEQCIFLGGTPPPPREQYSTPSEEKTIEIQYSKYPPENLDGLYSELSEGQRVFNADKFISSWIAYWAGVGQGLKLVSSFEKFWKRYREFPYLMRQAIGEIFTLSYKLQGEKAAYSWAVRDIRTNNHWGRWSGSRSEESLKKYAQIYSAEWKQLLTDTTVGESIKLRGNEWVVVPSCQLVSYLLAAGQSELACQITEVMLASLEAEISHLPISPLHWHQTPVSSERISSKILLLHYKWPDRFIRRRTAMQIANLLDVDPGFRTHYLEQLASLKHEADISDFLYILMLAESEIFPVEALIAAIKFPSALSDEVLQRLGYEYEGGEITGYFSALTEEDYKFSDRFEKSKNGIAPIYFSPIEILGKKLGYPLEKHLSAEWDFISERQQFLFFNHHDFSGEHFFPQDLIGCSLSIEAETVLASAYVRTISFAAKKFGLPQDFVSHYTENLFPFCGLLGRLIPAMKPKNWPQLKTIGKDGQLPSQSDLDGYLTDLASGEDVLLCANGPVLRQMSGVNCDLEIKTVFIENDYDGDAKTLYLSLSGQDGGIGVEAYQIAKEFYPDDIGRFETDLLLRGLFQPRFVIGGPYAEIQADASSIQYISNDVCSATWKYWTDSWYPVWYRGVGPALGTYLETSNEIFSLIKEHGGGSYYMLAKLTIVDKRGHSRDENKSEIYEIKRV